MCHPNQYLLFLGRVLNLAKVQNAFGSRLRELRQLQCLTQEELAHLAGLNRTFIGDIERGEKNITLKSMDKLARALGIKLRDFLTGNEENLSMVSI